MRNNVENVPFGNSKSVSFNFILLVTRTSPANLNITKGTEEYKVMIFAVKVYNL